VTGGGRGGRIEGRGGGPYIWLLKESRKGKGERGKNGRKGETEI